MLFRSFNYVLDRDIFMEGWVNTKSFWFFDVGLQAQTPYVDDRELYDGTPLQRQAAFGGYAFMNTDSRERVQASFYFTEMRGVPRFERLNTIGGSLIFRPVPRVDGQLDLAYNETAGAIRQISVPSQTTSTDDVTARASRTYILAPQQARSVSATLRATYAFTPFLTLQAYAQLFTAGISYGAPLQATRGPGRQTITIDELTPADPASAPNADERQIGLNVNVILRWEWRTGSTFYLVYAHQSSNDIAPPPGPRGLDFQGELSAFGQPGVTHGDTVLLKVDLLSAL